MNVLAFPGGSYYSTNWFDLTSDNIFPISDILYYLIYIQ